MKIANCKLILGLICLNFFCSINVNAQDEARAAWQATKFDITVASLGSDRALTARAVVSVRNVGRGAGTTLSLRINPKAEIKSVTIGSANATYVSRPESRGNAQRLTITLPNSIPANESVTATVEYRLAVAENTGLASISPIESQFLPQSMWYPIANNAFALRGADYAPFRLTITGGGALSSGEDKSVGGNSAFEQTLNAQPFFVAGTWDRVDGGAAAKGISAYLLKGATADEQKQAAALIALANDARAFYASMFGATPDVPLRLISVTRGGGFDDGGTILLGEGSFRRKKIDAMTAISVAEAVAHLWIGGDAPVRGEGHGVLREGLARFLATLFIEKQFGAEAAESERARQRVAYSAIAKRDAPLSRTTLLDPTYFNSVDQVTDMDLLAGLPRQEGGQWTAALRNLGSMEAVVNVIGVTNSGQQVNASATIPPHDFGQAVFKTTNSIVRVEVDPEKYYPQLDYADDVAPRVPEVAESLAEANRLYGAQEFAKSESLARQLLAASAQLQEARIVLGRALLAQNKNDEAEKEFKQLLNERLPTPSALAWASIGLGEIALRRGQAAEASRNFTDAIRADAEYAATLNARAERIRAESSGAAPPIDESAKNFINQLDAAIRTGRQADILPMISSGELAKFVQQIVGTQPEAWQTRVLRTEALDANRIAVEVALNTKQLGVEHSGTAVYVLARAGGNLRLNAIELFEVR